MLPRALVGSTEATSNQSTSAWQTGVLPELAARRFAGAEGVESGTNRMSTITRWDARAAQDTINPSRVASRDSRHFGPLNSASEGADMVANTRCEAGRGPFSFARRYGRGVQGIRGRHGRGVCCRGTPNRTGTARAAPCPPPRGRTSYVLEGTIGARVGDQEVAAGPGSYLFKPRGLMHTFWNVGPGPARLLEVIALRASRFTSPNLPKPVIRADARS